jgi:hypothetical protein
LPLTRPLRVVGIPLDVISAGRFSPSVRVGTPRSRSESRRSVWPPTGDSRRRRSRLPSTPGSARFVLPRLPPPSIASWLDQCRLATRSLPSVRRRRACRSGAIRPRAPMMLLLGRAVTFSHAPKPGLGSRTIDGV